MILSDRDIVRRLHYDDRGGSLDIDPMPDDDQIQPASVDLRLGHRVYYPVDDEMRAIVNGLDLHPGEFVLAETRETVKVPVDLVGHMTGRSTVGRRAVIVHATAGLVDPGWHGTLTLEMANIGADVQRFEVGDRVAQIEFCKLLSESSGYQGQYQGDGTVQPAGDL